MSYAELRRILYWYPCAECESQASWLFDKEERMRKAAAYFARQRIADTAVKEPIEDCI